MIFKFWTSRKLVSGDQSSIGGELSPLLWTWIFKSQWKYSPTVGTESHPNIYLDSRMKTFKTGRDLRCHVPIPLYSRLLNNTGLNCLGPLIHGFFSPNKHSWPFISVDFESSNWTKSQWKTVFSCSQPRFLSCRPQQPWIESCFGSQLVESGCEGSTAY